MQENKGGLKLDEAHHLLVYTEYELIGWKHKYYKQQRSFISCS